MTPLHKKIHDTIPTLEGWVSAERGCEMADLILEHKPSLCVEIGVFGGRSLISQAMALKEVGSGRIVGIDPWKLEAAQENESKANSDWWASIDLNKIHNDMMQRMWSYGLEETAIIIRSKGHHVAWAFSDESIGQLFIDSNHSEAGSVRDTTMWLPKVKRGGIVIFDDTDWPSTQKAVAILDQSCDLIKDSGKYRIYRKK